MPRHGPLVLSRLTRSQMSSSTISPQLPAPWDSGSASGEARFSPCLSSREHSCSRCAISGARCKHHDICSFLQTRHSVTQGRHGARARAGACVRVCVRACACACFVCARMRMCMGMCRLRAHAHVCVCAHVCTRMCMCMGVCLLRAHAHVRV